MKLIHKNSVYIEQFLTECRKTKTKEIALANHNAYRQYSEPIKTRTKHRWLTRSAGKRVRTSHVIGFGFISDWMREAMVNKIDRPNTTPIGRLVLSLTFKVWL